MVNFEVKSIKLVDLDVSHITQIKYEYEQFRTFK